MSRQSWLPAVGYANSDTQFNPMQLNSIHLQVG